MSTRSLTVIAGLALTASALCWAAWGEEGHSMARPAAAASPEPISTIAPASFLPDAPAPSQHHRLPARPVRPVVLPSSSEQYLVMVQPILDALPHLNRNDLYKLDNFCPADFNKDDRIDEQDIALFAQTWADESSPLFNWCDMTADGVVDETDAIEFMHQYREGPHNCEELKEYRGSIC